ncbi:MAG: hypothetical protein M3A44_15080 [Gammaproteobacteria bacterium]
MEVKTEPAGRLYDIFHEAKLKPEAHSSRKVWAEVFDVPEEDTGTILKMLAELIQLTHATKEKLEKLNDINHELYLRPFSQIERVLSHINLDAGWKHWKDQIDEPTIYGLQFCSDKLNRVTNYTKIPNEEIDSIKQSLSELTDQILNSELDNSLKELLVRNLEGLRQAIISFKIKGIEGIQREVELNLGSIILHREEIRSKSISGKESALLSKYFKFIEGLNKTISTAKNIKELGGKDFLKLIGIDNG